MYVIPMFILITVLFSICNKVNPLDSFIDGVLDGFKLLLKIYPTILSMIFACTLLVESGLLDKLGFIDFVPYELVVQGIIKPLSGSGATTIMINIFDKYGVDSNTGIASSILDSTSETTFYVMSLYFSSVGVKKYRYAIIVGLISDFIGFMITLLMFKYIL